MSEERIVYQCACGQTVAAPKALAGKRARCPVCGRISTVGGPGRSPASPRDAKTAPRDAEPDALAGRVCSVCQSVIGRGEAACLCPECRSPFHRGCWDEVGGCATYGCTFMPQLAKPVRDESRRQEVWGDEKACPNCGGQIRAAAVKCRFCGVRFPSSVPMSPEEYQEWRAKKAQLAPVRLFAIVLFALSVLGFLAPLAFPVGVVWLWRSHAALRRAGGLHEVFAYFGVGLSLIYCVIFVACLV